MNTDQTRGPGDVSVTRHLHIIARWRFTSPVGKLMNLHHAHVQKSVQSR